MLSGSGFSNMVGNTVNLSAKYQDTVVLLNWVADMY